MTKLEKRDYDRKYRHRPEIMRRERARAQARYFADPFADRKRTSQWKRDNPDKMRLIREREIARIPRWYLRQLIHNATGIPLAAIPEELMRLKRAQIKLHRRMKNERAKHR